MMDRCEAPQSHSNPPFQGTFHKRATGLWLLLDAESFSPDGNHQQSYSHLGSIAFADLLPALASVHRLNCSSAIKLSQNQASVIA